MPPQTSVTVVGSTLTGVTTAIVVFILLCLAFPGIIRHRPRFHAAFIAVLTIILLETLNLMVRGPNFQVAVGIAVGLLQIACLTLLFMASSGLSFVEMTRELGRYYQARYGEPAGDGARADALIVVPPPRAAAVAPPQAAADAVAQPAASPAAAPAIPRD